MLPRAHQLLILVLSLILTGLLAWRADWPRSQAPAPLPALSFFFVAIEGDVLQPGVRVFPAPPTVARVWQAAGGQGEMAADSQPLPSGSTIVVAPDRQVAITPMAGADLITLGLPVDLNRAKPLDLEAVPGLGPVLAQRIVAHRSQHGPFRDAADLLQVPGIGPKLLEKIRPYVVIIGNMAPAAADPHPEKGAGEPHS